MTAMFYLEPLDIMNLDFRDQIQIDNSYWRINEIKGLQSIQGTIDQGGTVQGHREGAIES
jgi:hypothetical protein